MTRVTTIVSIALIVGLTICGYGWVNERDKRIELSTQLEQTEAQLKDTQDAYYAYVVVLKQVVQDQAKFGKDLKILRGQNADIAKLLSTTIPAPVLQLLKGFRPANAIKPPLNGTIRDNPDKRGLDN